MFTGSYQARIRRGLDRAYQGVLAAGNTIEADVDNARIIIFSDHHRGVCDGADDFAACEQAYSAALKQYLASGHSLVILGDAEELWECRPSPVLAAYRGTIELEASFHRQGRYFKIYGNHDDLWREAGAITRYLGPFYQPPLSPRQGLGVRFFREKVPVGELFLTHGHQGSLLDDQCGWLTRLFVRYVWRNIQRLTGIRTTTPAKNARLRDEHSKAMYEWALGRNQDGAKMVLIAGHTHAPVFLSKSHGERLLAELKTLQEKLALASLTGDPREANLVARRLETVRARFRRLQEKEDVSVTEDSYVTLRRPCYFNSGCCSFSDGDITGIEIANGEIRLVKWTDDQENPGPRVLESARIVRDVFDAL